MDPMAACLAQCSFLEKPLLHRPVTGQTNTEQAGDKPGRYAKPYHLVTGLVMDLCQARANEACLLVKVIQR
jgi:hypothetical protein